MGERNTSSDRKIKAIPWKVFTYEKPADVEGFAWVPIKENELKPKQRQGWKRIPTVVKESSVDFNMKLVSTEKKPPSAQRPSNMKLWHPDAPLVEGEN